MMKYLLGIPLLAVLPVLFMGAASRPRNVTPTLPPVAATAPRPAAVRASGAKPPMVEARAIWVPRMDYNTATIPEVMRLAARAHFNIVYLQVRGPSDALYPSQLDPCSIRLCGRLGGVPPATDPLELAVREAHRNGLQLHAWINALSGWESESSAKCGMLRPSAPGQPNHVLIDHPEWAVRTRSGRLHRCPNGEDYVFLSPAVPGVRTHLARVAADVVRRYDVDGVHLDRIRYPGEEFGWDSAALAEFGRDPRADSAGWARFRRELVNRTVREVYDSIHAVRPVPLSAAVWPIYDRRRFGWDALARPSSSGIDQYFQDPWTWARDGYFDAAVPMTYSTVTTPACGYTQEQHGDWRCIVRDQVAGVQPSGRHVYAGILAGLGADEVEREIRIGRELGVNGFSIYFYGQVVSTNLLRRLPEGPFRDVAVVPPMPWLQSTATATGSNR
ncbi:MAG TPA: family 10 glycosylhydrolase [Longimicrobium sp.]